MTEQYESPQERADRLHVNVETILRQIRSGELKAIKVGKMYRIPVETKALSVAITEQQQALNDYELKTLQMKQEIERIEVESKLKQVKGEFIKLSEVEAKKLELDTREKAIAEKETTMQNLMKVEDLEKWQAKLEHREKQMHNFKARKIKYAKAGQALKELKEKLANDKERLIADKAQFVADQELEAKKLAVLQGNFEEKRQSLVNIVCQFFTCKNDRERANILAGLHVMYGISTESITDKRLQKTVEDIIKANTN